MRFPFTYFLLDVVANAVFGFFILQASKGCGCSGDCDLLKIWSLVVAIMLFTFAGFHFLVILDRMCDGKLQRVPLLGEILRKFWYNWTDIYLGCMIFIWGGALALFILNNDVMSCDKKLIKISGIYLIYSAVIAILYGTNRDRITSQGCDF